MAPTGWLVIVPCWTQTTLPVASHSPCGSGMFAGPRTVALWVLWTAPEGAAIRELEAATGEPPGSLALSLPEP
ncbi:MAG TPA: hypothetical protein VLK89_05620 [Solirubrobacterales bacterium]|nr:hypothetical protein [Solirubrobacterales bacterium]